MNNSEKKDGNLENIVEIETVEEITEEIENNTNTLVSIEYDVKNDEEGQAFLLFQKKYVYKKNWIKTAVFAVAAVLFIISIGRNPSQPMNYILASICIAGIFIIWYNTKRIRISLLEALKLIEDDKYIFTLYNDRFSIETILAENTDENGEKIAPVEPRIVYFSDTLIDIIETEKMFVIILKKDTIYVLPKRCMNQGNENVIRDKFLEKNSERFEKI